MNKRLIISLTAAQDGRLDKVLAAAAQEAAAEGLSRARLQQLIKEGCVALGGQAVADPNRKTQAGESFEITLPAPVQAEPEAQEIALDILFEDKDLLVLNKPAGLVVHPAAGN